MPKNLLIFFPHNFFELKSGCHKRIYELMKYFKTRDFTVDFYSLENFENSWKDCDFRKDGLINELFLYDFNEGRSTKSRALEQGIIKKIVSFLVKRRVIQPDGVSQLHDFAFPGMKKQFREILSRKKYDFVVITYTFWARLLEGNRSKDIITVLEMQDFLSLNIFDSCGGKVKVGSLIEEEIDRVNLFDKVLCISEEERAFFSRFARNPEYFFTPLSLPRRVLPRDKKYAYDIMFIASGNPHNQAGIAWFFNSVYPLLSSTYRIAIIGEITKYVDNYPNVAPIEHVDNIDDVYLASRISICPLLGGTGLKIKVVEALSYGQPVVSTSYGVTGFHTKTNNGCCVSDDPTEFAHYIKRLIEDEMFYDQQSNVALSFFLDNFEESHVYRLLDKVFWQQERV
jgi:glycosyltransferase involved in cell wall biosynthesis